MQGGQFCTTFNLHGSYSKKCQECVATELQICLFSGLHSSPLGLDREVQICADDMHVSYLQVKGGRHHLSLNIGLTVIGSAGPAQLPLG